MVDKENLVVGGNAGVSIFFDSKDNFWVGTGNGLCKLDEKTGEVDRIFLRKADSSYVGQNIISNILEDAMGRIWVGLFQFGGLYLLDTENKVGREYIGGVDLSELYLDKSGLVWAGTPDGLYYYDEQTDSFTRFFNPLLNGGIPEVASIVEDDEQHLWVSSSIGLIRINPSRDELSIFDRDMGVGSYNFYWSSAYRDKEGKVYIGNDEGYFVIDPKLLSETLKAPEIRLSGFSLGDEKIIPGENSLLKQEIDKTEEILLGYDQNIFSFDFATIDYNDPENNRMIYYLENYDNNWKLANSENKAYYFNVPPGNYTFHIKGSKGVGPWTHKEISIVISPPWWQTWWAYTIYAILLALAVFGFDRFMRQRLIRIERERSREKELEQAREIEKAYTELKNTQAQLIQSEKMASLGELTAGIAHEIQNPLNFVNNFSEVSRELLTEMREELEKGDLKEAKEISTDIEKNLEKISYHGERASDIVKGMLQHSRSVGASKESTDINKLADEYFRLAYHGLRAKDKSFNAKMDTSFEEKLDKVKVIPQEMGRVILNLITNAFYVVNEKGKSGLDDYEPTVLVGTRMNENHVEVFVRDNGNGIPKQVLGKIFQPFFTTKPTGRGTGLGLSLSYDIVKAHGGELLVDTKEGEGTTFTIRIPKS
jgi:signal transduction histidine kinase